MHNDDAEPLLMAALDEGRGRRQPLGLERLVASYTMCSIDGDGQSVSQSIDSIPPIRFDPRGPTLTLVRD